MVGGIGGRHGWYLGEVQRRFTWSACHDGAIVAASISSLLTSRSGSRRGPLLWSMLLASSIASVATNIAVA